MEEEFRGGSRVFDPHRFDRVSTTNGTPGELGGGAHSFKARTTVPLSA